MQIRTPSLLVLLALACCSPNYAQRTVASPILRKVNREIPVLKGDDKLVAATKAELQARFVSRRQVDRQTLPSTLKTRPAIKLDLLPATTVLTQSTETNALSATLSPANPVTADAYLDFINAAHVSAKDNEAKFVQTGEQTEDYGSIGKLFHPTASMYLAFNMKKKRRYYIDCTFSVESYLGSENPLNQMLAFPPGIPAMDYQTHFTLGITKPDTYEMEWIYNTEDFVKDGWSGFEIALLKPGAWYLKSVVIKEISIP